MFGKPAWNKGITGVVTAFDLQTKIFIKIPKEEFDKEKYIRYVGTTSKLITSK